MCLSMSRKSIIEDDIKVCGCSCMPFVLKKGR